MKKRATRVRRMAVAGIGAACLMLTACAGQNADSGGSDSGGEKPELVFWSLPYGPDDAYAPALQKIIDEYNAGDHSATVRLEMLTWSGFSEQFQTALAAGTPPDITTNITYSISKWAEAGEVLDLTSIVEKWEEEEDEILDDFLPGTLESGKIDGKYYSIPFMSSPTTIYYRKDILEDELGFTDLDQPVTWDKMYEMCEAVKERYNGDIIPFSFCVLDQNSSNTMINVLFSNGASWVNEDGTAGALDSAKAEECMGFFKTMYDRGYFPEGVVTYNQADLEKLYQSGKTAIVWNAPISTIASDEELVNNTKMMGPLVGPSSDEPRYVMRTSNTIGFAKTKYPEETKEFIEWFTKNNLEIFTKGSASLLPLRSSYLEDPFFETDWAMSMYAQYNDYYTDITWPSSVSPSATEQILTENVVGRPLEALLMGSTDQKSDLKDAQESINKVFDQYK